MGPPTSNKNSSIYLAMIIETKFMNLLLLLFFRPGAFDLTKVEGLFIVFIEIE